MGTGDGSYVINQARQFPNTFFIGIDANAAGLIDCSRKTFMFNEKRGLTNALFVHASIENLPSELYQLATQITILLPWGSLLQAVAKPQFHLLNEIKKLARADAAITILFGYEKTTEQKQMVELELPELTPERVKQLIQFYSRLGFKSLKWRMLQQDELKSIPSTWAKKLVYGKKRQFIEIKAVIGWNENRSGA